MFSRIAPLAVAFAITVAGGAFAAPIGGTGALGSYTGSLTYAATDDTSATLTIALTNTSPAANGGFLTAFVLNNPGGLTAISLTSAPSADWDALGLVDNGVNGAPNGQFDFGASTGGSFEGGGPPSDGLAVGASGNFVFNLTGTGLLGMTDNSFINAVSVAPGIGEGPANFVARFRGFADGGSDKVPNTVTPPNPGVPVPEPASLALFGAGIAALGLFRRRRVGG